MNAGPQEMAQAGCCCSEGPGRRDVHRTRGEDDVLRA